MVVEDTRKPKSNWKLLKQEVQGTFDHFIRTMQVAEPLRSFPLVSQVVALVKF
jgi:hypothetical protein